MRITRTLAAGAALAVAAACGQRPAAGPAPAAEREFEYIATNASRTTCTMAYGVKGDTTAVVVGEVPAGGIVSFTVRQPEGGPRMVLHASCGENTFTRDLRPRMGTVAIGNGPSQGPAIRESLPRCGGVSRYTAATPACGIPNVGENSPATRGREGSGGGSGGAGNTDPAVAPTGRKP